MLWRSCAADYRVAGKLARMRAPAPQGIMRQPPVAAGGGGMLSVIKSLPAPVGGWNARDPLAQMKPIDAVKLENWFARVADCVIRGGCADHVTGFVAKPRTLVQHASLTAANKMFAASDTGVYDVSAAGVLGALVLARTQGYHSWTQMGVSGGNYLIMVNGVDKPAYYDGATWVAVDGVSVPALTGLTTTTLISANVYKRRLFFLQTNKNSFWYLPADAVGGALNEFQLGPLCNKGGYTMAMGTWTLDGGNGPDDYIVFVTSEGEAIIFSGTNPADATAWALQGVYFIGKPLGRRCVKKYGGDLLIMTEFGALPISKMLLSSTVDYRSAITNKIEGAFVDAARFYGGNTGWTIEIYPAQAALVVNVPTGATTSEQYVMNTTTKSWCKFTGWNASDFIVYGKELYYADQTKIAKAWTTSADYGANIVADAQTAFNNHNDGSNKDWGLFRPILRVNGTLNFQIGVAVDFEPNPGLTTATYTVVSGARWDVSSWDQGFWAAGLEAILDWRTPGAKIGQYGAGLLKVATNSLTIQWAANDYCYTKASVVT